MNTFLVEQSNQVSSQVSKRKSRTGENSGSQPLSVESPSAGKKTSSQKSPNSSQHKSAARLSENNSSAHPESSSVAIVPTEFLSTLNNNMNKLTDAVMKLTEAVVLNQTEIGNVRGQMMTLNDRMTVVEKKIEESVKKAVMETNEKAFYEASSTQIRKTVRHYVVLKANVIKYWGEGKGSEMNGDSRSAQMEWMKILVEEERLPEGILNNNSIHKLVAETFSDHRSNLATWVRTAGILLLEPAIEVKLFPEYKTTLKKLPLQERKEKQKSQMKKWKEHWNQFESLANVGEKPVECAVDVMTNDDQKTFARTASNVAYCAVALSFMIHGKYVDGSSAREKYFGFKTIANELLKKEREQFDKEGTDIEEEEGGNEEESDE